MAEQTITANKTATRPEQGEMNAEQRIWQSVDFLVRGRFKEAQQALVAKHSRDTSPAATLDLALAMHTADMQDVEDPEDLGIDVVTADRITLAMLEMPQAASALARSREGQFTSQDEKETTALTLARFNQDLSEALAFMPPKMLKTFPVTFREQCNSLLRDQWHVATMPVEELNGRFAGISGETAVWRALEGSALPKDWEVDGATPEEDVLGTDLIVYDADDNELRLDAKRAGKFVEGLKDEYNNGFITIDEVEAASRNGYYYSPRRTPNGAKVDVCVFDTDRLGTIENFQYKKEDTENVVAFIEKQFAEQRGKRLRVVGKSAINS